MPEVVNTNAEVGRSMGRGKQERKNWEGQRHHERDTEDAEKKGQAGRQRKKETECGVGQGPLDSKEAGQVNIHSR